MSEETVGALLDSYFKKRRKSDAHWASTSEQAGLDHQHIKRIIKPKAGTNPKPEVGTLLKIADALRLNDDERAALEQASGHLKPGCLKRTHAERYEEPTISMRRAVLLLTAPKDPSPLPEALKRKDKRYAEVAIRTGVVFGLHDVVVRATTPFGVSVLNYSQELFDRGKLRTVETIPLRDDMPIYLDKTFSNEHLGDADYLWATIFVEALGGERKPEFPEIFYDVAQGERFGFWGGVHLLTAAITVGQFDSVVELLAVNQDVLQRYVREAQDFAWAEYGREAHTITYFSNHLRKPKIPVLAE
jgi:hypothetical protein